MTALPVLWAASLLLIAGGIAKVRHPAATIPALRAVGVPAHRRGVVCLGILEIATGVGAIAGISPGFDVTVAALYATFTVFSARLTLLDVPGMSCGCAGQRAIPPSWLHVWLNATAVAGAVAAWWSTAPADAAGVAVLALGSAAIAWAAFLAVAYVPTLFASYRGAS